LGWAWITGLTVGSFFGLYADGRATERDAESAGRDGEPPDDLGEDD
jgi:hypothetical protein